MGCGPDDQTRQGNLIKGVPSDATAGLDVDLDVLHKDFRDDDVDPSTHAVEHLNKWRGLSGQPEVRENSLLKIAAQNHADYLAAHPEALSPGADPHLESPDSPLFTGLKVQQRVEAVGYDGKSLGENIARRATSEAALQSWLETLYSRLPLMDTSLEEIGVGEAGPLHDRVYVLVAGTQAGLTTNTTTIRTFPPDGAEDIMPQWNGNELPQPKPPPDGYPSGPVISLHTGEIPFDGVAATLRNPAGQKVSSTSFTVANDPNLLPGVAAIIAHEPLLPNAPYSVSWTGSINGDEFTIDHSFHTASNTCQPTEQDCGHGRACYIQQGKDTCLWVGPLSEGEPCLFINDCSSGLGCYGLDNTQLCRRYCVLDGPSNCDTTCSGQYSVLDDEANTGFCWNLSKD